MLFCRNYLTYRIWDDTIRMNKLHTIIFNDFR